jgi:acyl carrier protein
MHIRKRIREYILRNFLFTDDESALIDSDSFLAAGFIDSTGVLEIVSLIEDDFRVSVDEDEMLPENLDSVDNLVAFVLRKQAIPV